MLNLSVLLFDGFEALDVFGPVEVLSKLPDVAINYYSFSGGKIKSAQQFTIETQSCDLIEQNSILLVPGGPGVNQLLSEALLIDKLAALLTQSAVNLTVCTGSALVAQTGLLNGCQATTNKRLFNWVKELGQQVEWLHHARWVCSGKFYTSSGVSAGIDMTLSFIQDQFGLEEAKRIAKRIEYSWNQDAKKDPFSYVVDE